MNTRGAVNPIHCDDKSQMSLVDLSKLRQEKNKLESALGIKTQQKKRGRQPFLPLLTPEERAERKIFQQLQRRAYFRQLREAKWSGRAPPARVHGKELNATESLQLRERLLKAMQQKPRSETAKQFWERMEEQECRPIINLKRHLKAQKKRQVDNFTKKRV